MKWGGANALGVSSSLGNGRKPGDTAGIGQRLTGLCVNSETGRGYYQGAHVADGSAGLPVANGLQMGQKQPRQAVACGIEGSRDSEDSVP